MRIAIPSLLLAAAVLRGQTIELQNGEIVAGRVTVVTDASLTIRAGHPDAEEHTFSRSEVAPRSWFQLLQTRVDGTDAKAHLMLAGVAEQLELPGHAIAELQQAAQLDRSLAAEAERRIAALRTGVAAELLTTAREAAADGRLGEAKLGAQLVADKYGDTPSAAGARELAANAIAQLEARSTSVAAAASAAPDAKVLAQIEQLEAKADKLAATTGGGIGPTVKETRQRENAAKLLDQALTALDKAGVADDAAVRMRVRGKLRDQYLALATNLLQRRSLDKATEYNGKACALDPRHGGCHHLQDLIVQARLTYGY
jgi:hypothetical protein